MIGTGLRATPSMTWQPTLRPSAICGRRASSRITRERITAAKELAIQQLAEDIIFKLRANLFDVRRQIDDLNRALKDVPFGNDRYEFRVDVSAEHRDFYQLIMGSRSLPEGLPLRECGTPVQMRRRRRSESCLID